MDICMLFAYAFKLECKQPIEQVAVPCAITGRLIDYGVNKSHHIKPTTSELADLFNGEYISLEASACMEKSKLLAGNIFASERDGGLKPVVAIASATKSRPTWRDLVRSLDAGQRCVAVVTSNTKRRLWYRAPLSTIGNMWQVLFCDGNFERVLTVSLERLLKCLDLVETIMAAGFSKAAIRDGLWSKVKVKDLSSDYHMIVKYENALNQWRNTDEFVFALFIAQVEKD